MKYTVRNIAEMLQVSKEAVRARIEKRGIKSSEWCPERGARLYTESQLKRILKKMDTGPKKRI